MLSPDAQRLLELLPETGRIVNATAMALTGWDYDRMRAAKFELRDAGLVEMRASFGGPFGRTTNEPKATTSNNVLAAAENELYEPFRNWINEEFRPTDFVVGRDLFEVVVSANKRPNGSGKWEIPDLITVSIKKYRFVPELDFKTISFEVKPKGQAFNTYGIFEAISHSKFGSLTYYCFEYPKEDDFYDNTDYQRVEQEAKTHGIGLIQVWFKDEQKKYLDGQIILEAKPKGYDPGTLSNFIERFFPEEVKNRISVLTHSF
jgi:hypothetical protein